MLRPLIVFLASLFTTLSALADADILSRISTLRERADSLHSVGHTDSAAVVGEQAIRLAVESGDKVQIVGTHGAQGVFLRSLGRIDEALASYGKALEIITSGEFRDNPSQEAIEEIASLYINLAVLNLDTAHKEQAAENAVLAATWIARSDDPGLRSTIYGVAGSVLTGCGSLPQALHYQALAYQDALEAGNPEAAFRAAAYTMLISSRAGRDDETALWRRRCQELLPQVEAMMARLVYYQAECSISLAAGRSREAIGWFEKILALDGIDHLPFVKFDCYNNMHRAYAALSDYDDAYSTLLLSNELRDSLWQREKDESLRDLTVKYQTKETQLALAESETRRARTTAWLLGTVALLVVAMAGWALYAARQRRRSLQREVEFASLRAETARQLTRQYVEGLESERRRMSAELHDGVCNDLLAIQMNISGGAPIEATASLIDACRDAVRRISHELMPPEFAYASIDEVVRHHVAKQRGVTREGVSLVYLSDAEGREWTDVPDDVSLEVYRILQEALGNAVRHSGATEITIGMSLRPDVLEASVSDNGRFRPSSRRGLGLDSMRRRAGAIGGKVRVDASAERGTTVTLRVDI